MSEQELLPIAGKKEAFAALLPLLRSHRKYVALVIVAGFLSSAAGLVAPWVIGRLVDVLREAPAMPPVWWGAGAIALAGAVSALGAWAGQAWLGRVTEPTVAGLREAVVEKALAIDSADIERTGTGDLVSRVAEDAREISESTATILPLFVQSFFTVIVSGAGLLAVDWRLGLVGLLAVPMYWTTLRWYLPRSGPIYRQERAAFGRRASRMLGGLNGAETLRAYDAQEVELRRIDAASREARDLSVGVFAFLTRAFSRNNRAEVVVLGLLLITGFVLVDGGQVTAGAVTTAALVFHRLFNPIGALVGLFDQVQSAGASLTRMVGVINLPLPVRSAVPGTGALQLEDIAHAYGDGPPALRGVNLRIQPDEVVAVVGSTGAGKSTLAQIAAGVINPVAGSASIGGTVLREVDSVELRSSVCMVSQEVHSFAATIAENVRMARPDAGDDEVRAALQVVGAGWVQDLPQGIATAVGDGGHRLTPMQDQTIALARVILADPRFVVLDEATAEAGSAGARMLDTSAQAVLEGRGGLVVAHRLSQAVAADRILVLEDGEVVEAGTHEELRRAGGRYEELWSAWIGN